jgi:hypothetical protein
MCCMMRRISLSNTAHVIYMHPYFLESNYLCSKIESNLLANRIPKYMGVHGRNGRIVDLCVTALVSAGSSVSK